jgi:hypothetical protein
MFDDEKPTDELFFNQVSLSSQNNPALFLGSPQKLPICSPLIIRRIITQDSQPRDQGTQSSVCYKFQVYLLMLWNFNRLKDWLGTTGMSLHAGDRSSGDR